MMRRAWARLVAHLTPSRLHTEAALAHADAEEARRRLDAVAARDPEINQLVRAHERDRARNHYGERVEAALRRKHGWT